MPDPYSELSDQLKISPSERQRYLNELIRLISTTGQAQRNTAVGQATRAGASQGAQNALESRMAYSTSQAGEQGVNSLNKRIDEQNRMAEQYLEELRQRDKAARWQMIGNIGSAIGMIGGNILAPGLGSALGMAMPKKQNFSPSLFGQPQNGSNVMQDYLKNFDNFYHGADRYNQNEYFKKQLANYTPMQYFK